MGFGVWGLGFGGLGIYGFRASGLGVQTHRARMCSESEGPTDTQQNHCTNSCTLIMTTDAIPTTWGLGTLNPKS